MDWAFRTTLLNVCRNEQRACCREDAAVLFPCTWFKVALARSPARLVLWQLGQEEVELQTDSRLLFYSTPLCALTDPR